MTAPAQITRLTNAQRNVLRSAISAHPDWRDLSRRLGLTTATLSSSHTVLHVASELGIDVQATLASHAPTAPAGLFKDGPARPAAPTQVAAPAQVTAPAPAVTAEPAAPMGASPSADVLTALQALMSVLSGKLDDAAVREIVRQETAHIVAPEPVTVVIVDNPVTVTTTKVDGPVHPQFETLLRVLTARDSAGFRQNAWITGPTGSGKTHAARQAAEALGLEFGLQGAAVMAHEIVGAVYAGGEYRDTQFVRRFRDGGVMLLDEIDSWDVEALLAINAALANGIMPLPDGSIIERHPEFVCIAAANTWGRGATADYVGRAKLDAATLSRFPIKLVWGYDEKLERELSGNVAWAERVQRARRLAEQSGLKVIIDPRHTMAGAALLATGMAEDDVANLTYLAGLTDAQRRLIENPHMA